MDLGPRVDDNHSVKHDLHLCPRFIRWRGMLILITYAGHASDGPSYPHEPLYPVLILADRWCINGLRRLPVHTTLRREPIDGALRPRLRKTDMHTIRCPRPQIIIGMVQHEDRKEWEDDGSLHFSNRTHSKWTRFRPSYLGLMRRKHCLRWMAARLQSAITSE